MERILEEDLKYRNNKNRDDTDLFIIDELQKTHSDSYDYPTLVSKNTVNQFFLGNEFIDNFYSRYPELYHLNTNNLLFAGGCISNTILNNKNNLESDVDIFIYGLNKEKANNKINEIANSLLNCNKIYIGEKNRKNKESKKTKKSKDTSDSDRDDENKNDFIPDKSIDKETYKSSLKNLINSNYTNNMDELKYVKTSNTITFLFGCTKYQIVLRLYRSKSEILHGFDLGSSAVGFDGLNVYFTSLSKFCYQNMTNIVDPTRRSTTYETRLCKYHDRGFNIVVPGLDLTKIKRDYLKYNLSEICLFPYLGVVYNQVLDNKIYVSDFIIHNKIFESDYEKPEYVSFNSVVEQIGRAHV